MKIPAMVASMTDAQLRYVLNKVERVLAGNAMNGAVTSYSHGFEYGCFISPRGIRIDVDFQNHAFILRRLLSDSGVDQPEWGFVDRSKLADRLGLIRVIYEGITIDVRRLPTEAQFSTLGRIVSALRKADKRSGDDLTAALSLPNPCGFAYVSPTADAVRSAIEKCYSSQ